MGGTLNNIYNNVSFALQLHTEALAHLQEQVSTGSRINRPSDDPSVAYQVLGFNSQGRSLGNYIDNVSGAVSTLEISSTIIRNMLSQFAEARTHLAQISAGIYGEATRERTAEGINEMLEQVLLLANTRHADQYLFGGGDTDSAPYVATRDSSGDIASVAYQGSYEDRDIEVASGAECSVFYVGDNIFRSNNRSDPEFILGSTGAAAGTGTSNVSGHTWLTVTGSAGNYNLSIDDGLTIFNTNGTHTNLPVTHSTTGEVLYVDTTNINSTGVDLVAVAGTHNVFDVLITIRNLLENEKALSDAQLQKVLNSTLSPLEEISSLLVQSEVRIGLKIGFLDDLKDNLQNLKYDAEDEATRLQEADIAQVAVDLSRREVLYQMSLSMAARIISMSLLDFLR